ncbi:MAG: hypothetical protein ACK4OM_02925 [Alphaproteobacteria bacterium]
MKNYFVMTKIEDILTDKKSYISKNQEENKYKKIGPQTKKTALSLSSSTNSALILKNLKRKQDSLLNKNIVKQPIFDQKTSETEIPENLSTSVKLQSIHNPNKAEIENNKPDLDLADTNSSAEKLVNTSSTDSILNTEQSSITDHTSQEHSKSSSNISLLERIFIKGHREQQEACNISDDNKKLEKLIKATENSNISIQNLVETKMLFTLDLNLKNNMQIYYLNNEPKITQEFNTDTKQLNFKTSNNFTGVIIVQRIDSNNNLIPNSYDLLHYVNDELVDILISYPVPTINNCRIYGIADAFFKERGRMENLEFPHLYTISNVSSTSKISEEYQNLNPKRFKREETFTKDVLQEKNNKNQAQFIN